MSFSTGDHVYAKWIGSGLHYPAKIVRSSGDHYTVEFQDGTRDKLSGKDITVSVNCLISVMDLQVFDDDFVGSSIRGMY